MTAHLPTTLAALGAFLLVGCSDPKPAPAIGFAYSWFDGHVRQFAQAELDRTRPPGADSIRLIALEGGFQNFGSSPLAAEIRRARLFVEDPSVVAAVGPGGSREAMRVAPVYATAALPNLVPAASSRRLAAAGAFSFMLSANDSVQGEFLAAFADSVLRARRVAIIYVPDEYGVGLATSIETSLRQRGVTVLDRAPIRFSSDCNSEVGRIHYARIVEQLALRGAPDAVVIAARTTSASCLIYALRGRWPALQLLAGDGVYLDDQMRRIAGTRAEGVHLVAHWHPAIARASSREFATRFRARTGLVPRHGDAVFVDAVMLAATAIREVGADRAAVTAYVRSLGVTRPPYQGITGRVSFGPSARHELLMTRIQGDSSIIVGRR